MKNQEAVKFQEALFHAKQLSTIASFNPNIMVISAVGFRDSENGIIDIASSSSSTLDEHKKLMEGMISGVIETLIGSEDPDDIVEMYAEITAKAMVKVLKDREAREAQR
ncbi:hypothetical protein PGRAN_02485 [Listeria grandensis FSL F6-0971]|uniref:Uncharacterized protein n=1 Tax=Listeria grandensis FSL F6-0971 TaxID=1265819 RepID=W7BNV7_9LIST|nr:hypothetical protein [Listeria grandensis]EUJ24726.1 hypothetical protein PGRAN_02485 [Listeria grandensis FSL F6-0971]